MVCNDEVTIKIVKEGLSFIASSTDVVKKVSEAPSDTKFSTYIKKLRDDKGGDKKDSSKSDNVERREQESCRTSIVEDMRQTDIALPTPAGQIKTGQSLLGLISLGLSFANMAKQGLAIAEKVKREKAVRDALKDLSVNMGSAIKKMEMKSEDENGTGDKKNAKSNLQRVIDFQRQMLALQISNSWDSFSECRIGNDAAANLKCLTIPTYRENLTYFISLKNEYKALQKVDSEKLLLALNKGKSDLDEGLEKGLTIPALLDGLVEVFDSLNSLNSSYVAFDKAKGE